MNKSYELVLGEEYLSVAAGTSFSELAKKEQEKYSSPILLATLNGVLHELGAPVEEAGELRFLTLRDKAGFQCYERSVILLLLAAQYSLYGKAHKEIWIDYKESGALRCRILGQNRVSREELTRLETAMRELVAAALPIEKRSVPTREAVRLFEARGMKDKAELFRFRIHSSVNLYRLGGYEDYFYGYMLPDSSYLNAFSLEAYEDGFVLKLPNRRDPMALMSFQPAQKIFEAMETSRENLERQGIETVGALNARAAAGKMKELILCAEAQMEKRIGDLAEKICRRDEVRIVLIAGPSSSGKTTFARRLATQLLALGKTPHAIEVDNYFKNRSDTPRDEKGNYDFEALAALDVDGFNNDLNRLLNGERIELPRFDFIAGERNYRGDYLHCGPSDILLIEGIHCLNEALSFSIPAEKKHKIYVSCLTQLNLDAHNRIPTGDARMLRRIVRDARLRGNDAAESLARWASVSAGEERYIFPNQGNADDVFNSALPYETAALKPYAEALLFGVPETHPSYLEAKRLLKFLSYFLTFPSEDIPATSLVREFIGGSAYGA